MVFKFLQKPTLEVKAYVFQLGYGLLGLGVTWFFQRSELSFLSGLLCSYIYILLLFYSSSFIFKQKAKLGIFLMFIKGLAVLILVLLLPYISDKKAFWFGFSALLIFLIYFAIGSFKKNKT